jgi:hypothetical protein
VSIAVVVLTLVLLAAVMLVVSAPLRSGGQDEPETPQHADLQAAREAKYREIRDTELDYRTGKLSSEDFKAVNGTLRAEAIEILDKLESLEAGGEESSETSSPEASSGPS